MPPLVNEYYAPSIAHPANSTLQTPSPTERQILTSIYFPSYSVLLPVLKSVYSLGFIPGRASAWNALHACRKTQSHHISIPSHIHNCQFARGPKVNASGLPCFNKWVADLMKALHSRDENEGWKISIGSGGQDILCKAFSALLNPGDTVLLEAPTYPSILPIIQALQCRVVELESDAEGISAVALRNILEDWDPCKEFPKFLYTVPFGSNPTGKTTSGQRRVDILRLARKHDLLILEDDPYYFLYYGLTPKPESYFALEKQLGGEIGRVLRVDSFSKVLAAGFRIGWVTGPSRLVDAIDIQNASTTVHPSSIGQIILFKLLKEWGISGFLAHTQSISEFYRRKRDYFEQCLSRHLTGMAEWQKPDASMFFWLTLILPPRLISSSEQVASDSVSFVRNAAINCGVLVLPGSTAYINNPRTTAVRVSFSLLTDEEMEEAPKRLATAVREQWDDYHLHIKHM